MKTGEETQVRFGKIAPVNMSKLKNIREICNQEKVYNLLLDKGVPASVIYPSSILLNNMDISVLNVPKRKLPVLKNPLQER